MTDRDDALRRELGWTGPEETDYEPPIARPEPAAPARPPVPSRPPVDFNPPDLSPKPPDEAATDDERAARVPPAQSSEAGPRGGQPDGPPPPFREPERPSGSFRQAPPRYGPPPGSPRDTGPMPTANRQEDTAWSQPPSWQQPPATRPAGQTGPATTAAWYTNGPRLGACGLRTRGGCPVAGVLRRPDQGRRPRAHTQAAARPRLASRVVQGHLRHGQSRQVARRDPAGRVGEQDQVSAARALQDRCDGQGRRREDDRVRQHRLGVRRAAPGRPGGGHRRRHRVRQAGQPRRPKGAGVLLGVGIRPAPRDLRGCAQPGWQQRGRPVRPRGRGYACTPPRPGSRDLSGSDNRGWTATSPSRSSTAARPWTPRSPKRYCGISTR